MNHIKFVRTGQRDAWERYSFYDGISGAVMTVEGSDDHGVTWHGAVGSFPWPNPVMAWNYARKHQTS